MLLRDTRSGVTAGKLLGRQDMITLACSGKASIKNVTFVTIGLTIHDGFCRKPSADIPVRAHRVSSLSLGAQLTVSVPHQPCSWSVSGDSSGTIADFPPICADCGVRYSEAQSSKPRPLPPPRDSRRII